MGQIQLCYRNRLLNGGRALQAFLQSKDMSWDLIEKGRSSQVDGILESFVRQMHDTDGKSSLLVAKQRSVVCSNSAPAAAKDFEKFLECH